MTNLLLDLKIKNPAKQILSGKTFTYYVCLTPSLAPNTHMARAAATS